MPFLTSLINQARYKAADIALAYDESSYSRYLIAPVGPKARDGTRKIGGAAIASGALGGFGGFIETDFLRHDYALGRLNAYRFLKRHLALPRDAENKVFESWTDLQRMKHGFKAAAKPGEPEIEYLPLIPVMDTVAEPKLPTWPQLAEFPRGLDKAIESRLDVVYALAKRQAVPSAGWRAALTAGLALPWRFYLRPTIRDFALDKIRKGLQAQNLLH